MPTTSQPSADAGRGKLTPAQLRILTALKLEPGEGWLTNAHIAQSCGQGCNRAWASGKMPRLCALGFVEVSADRLWRRITPAGREALSQEKALTTAADLGDAADAGR